MITIHDRAPAAKAREGNVVSVFHWRLYWRELVVSAVLFVGVIAIFGQTCFNGFAAWDDPQYVVANRHVWTGLRWENIIWAFTAVDCANWHPLTWLSLQLDAQLVGPRAWGFHATNVLFHAANSVLLFWALRMMTGATVPSGLVAALFAFHPLHVESVAWIAERKDVLSTFFWLATCLAYGWYAARPSFGRYLWALTAFALGLMAKPMLVTLPFVLLLLDYWPLRRLTNDNGRVTVGNNPVGARARRVNGPDLEPTNKATMPPLTIASFKGPSRSIASLTARPWVVLVLEKLPFLILAAGSCAITWYAQQYGTAIRSLEEYPVSVRAANAIMTYAAYIGQMFWPANLGVFYPHPGDMLSPQRWQTWAAGALLIGVTIGVCAKRRTSPYLPVGWFWYLGTLVPVIGLVQVGAAARADRYTYVPLIGLFVALVWGGAELASRWGVRTLAGVIAGLLVLTCAIRSQSQMEYWGSNMRLWEHALEVCGPSTVAHANLAGELMAVERYSEAIEHYHEALRLDPRHPEASNNLGIALAKLGKTEEAVTQFRDAVRKNPNWARAHWNLAQGLAELGRRNPKESQYRQEAILHYQEALRSDAHWAAAHAGWAELLLDDGKFEEAAQHFRAAIEGGYAHPSAYRGLERASQQIAK
jgi:tetratricopeptide (TPR) repeat protein